jgi:hypothetical protein
MISMYSVINEGKKLRYAGAALTGLGGSFTGGGLIGGIQGQQKSEYGKQIARQNKDPKAEYEHRKKAPLRMIGRSILGSIPVAGAVGNVISQRGLEKQKDELKKSFKK